MRFIDISLFIIYYRFYERNPRSFGFMPYFSASFYFGFYLFVPVLVIFPILSILSWPITILILYILLRWRLPKQKLVEFKEKYTKTKYSIFLLLFIILINLLACTYMIRYKPLG